MRLSFLAIMIPTMTAAIAITISMMLNFISLSLIRVKKCDFDLHFQFQYRLYQSFVKEFLHFIIFFYSGMAGSIRSRRYSPNTRPDTALASPVIEM